MTAVLTLAACPQWISSGGFPAQTCSAQQGDIQNDFQTVHRRAANANAGSWYSES